jgi:hypothetical protein
MNNYYSRVKAYIAMLQNVRIIKTNFMKVLVVVAQNHSIGKYTRPCAHLQVLNCCHLCCCLFM